MGAKKNPGRAWRCVIKEGCPSVHRRALGLLFMRSCHVSITAGLVSLMGALLVARATAGPPAPSVRSPRPTNPFAGATATGAAWLVPPLSPGAQAEARRIGARLLRAYQAGSLQLARPDREPAQLRQLAAQGFLWSPEEQPIALTLPLLRTLNHLVARSTRQRPLGLLSLYRPLSPSRPREPHGRGEAIDVTAFGGYTIHARNPEACVNGVITLIKALPPRAYRLGVPKAPHSDVFGMLPPPPRPRRPWPFFPPPLADTIDLPIVGRVARPVRDGSGRFARTRRGGIRAVVRRWENERYAPMGEIGSVRVKAALAQAARRGARVHALFPDALDHLHLDVKAAAP